jgi:hypothetical protein
VNATKMMRFENLIEEKDGEAGLLGASKWVLGNMNGVLEEHLGNRRVCDKLCLVYFFCNKSMFPDW